tara:strand:- start:294 stop:653 length:360 start_codon:yes stop_codon:yes gene_type:complete
MRSLFRYPGFKCGKLKAVVANSKIQLFEDGKLVDECRTSDNNLLYDIHVGYSEIPCEVRGIHRTVMYIAGYPDKEYSNCGVGFKLVNTYTFKEVLSVLTKNNDTPITPSANIPEEEFDY